MILVALMVLLVPELLTGPIRSAPRAAAVAPSAEEPPLRSYTINLADDTHSRSAAATTSGPQQPTSLSVAQPAAAESPPPPASSAAPRAPQAPPAAPPPLMPAKSARASAAAASAANSVAGDSGAWMVQLGSFASRTNAERLARQVRAGGFRVSVSQGSSGRRLYRVRVGPAHDREAATQLAVKLRAAGHSGSIVPK
jgi:cell division protein FtsN